MISSYILTSQQYNMHIKEEQHAWILFIIFTILLVILFKINRNKKPVKQKYEYFHYL